MTLMADPIEISFASAPSEAERNAEQAVQNIYVDLASSVGDFRRALLEFWELPEEARSRVHARIQAEADDPHGREYSGFMPVLLLTLIAGSKETVGATAKAAELPRNLSIDPAVRQEELRRIGMSAWKSLQIAGHVCKESLYEFKALSQELQKRVIERWKERNKKALASNSDNIAREILGYLHNPPKYQTE